MTHRRTLSTDYFGVSGIELVKGLNCEFKSGPGIKRRKAVVAQIFSMARASKAVDSRAKAVSVGLVTCANGTQLLELEWQEGEAKLVRTAVQSTGAIQACNTFQPENGTDICDHCGLDRRQHPFEQDYQRTKEQAI